MRRIERKRTGLTRCGGAGLLCVALLAPAASGQTLDQRLDEEAFLRGLVDYELPELLEHYLGGHPPADEAQAARYEIARERMRLRQSAPGSPDRLDAIESMLTIRRTLLKRRPGDPRWVIWAGDQAEDLLFELLPVEAAGLTTLFGLPSEAQRRRAEHVASEMTRLTERAETAIEQAILDLEAAPGYRDNVALQVQRRRLARDERERRIPFLRGIAAFLHAELQLRPAGSGLEQYELAARLLAPLGQELEGAVANEARLYCGYALARLGRFEEAETRFRTVAIAEHTEPGKVFAARMGGVMNRAVHHGPASALRGLASIKSKYAGGESIFYRVLIADREFRLRHRAARENGRSPNEAVSEALDAYLDLLDDAALGPSPTIRAVVLGKLSLAVGAEAPLEDLPAIVTLARAERLRRNRESAGEAIDLYRRLLRRGDVDSRDRVTALTGLGKALYAAGRPLEAMRPLLEAARDEPVGPEARGAVELAASIGSELHRRDPNHPAVRAVLREALLLLLDQYPDLPTADHWRFVAGRLAMSERDFDLAAQRFGEIRPEAEQWLDARFMYVNALRAAAKAKPLPDARAERRSLNERVLTEAAAAAGAIEHASASAPEPRRRDLDHYRAHLRVFRAEAMTELGRPEAALILLEELDPTARADRAVLAAQLHARVEAYKALGRLHDALQEIRRFVETAPREAADAIDAMLAPALDRMHALLEADRADDARRSAREELVPLAELMERSVQLSGLTSPVDEEALRHAADAYRLGERHRDALRLYDRLHRDFPNAVEILFGRAECLFGIGQEGWAEAMGLYKRIAAGGETVGRHYYWQSQLRLLQILDLVQRSTDKIVPRIQRLKLKDPELGGQRYRREFQRLHNKYS